MRVYTDISLLRTLNDRELRAGLAEVIKAGAIYSAPLFRELEDSADQVLGRDEAALASVIGQSIRIKVYIHTHAFARVPQLERSSPPHDIQPACPPMVHVGISRKSVQVPN